MMLPKQTLAWLASTSLLLSTTWAMHADEAGLSDFLLKTAGGVVTKAAYASPDNSVLITSSPNNSCYLAAREVETGTILWRRNVCSEDGSSLMDFTVSSDGSIVYTSDGAMIKAFGVDGGNMMLDAEQNVSSDGTLVDLLGGVGFVYGNNAKFYAVPALAYLFYDDIEPVRYSTKGIVQTNKVQLGKTVSGSKLLHMIGSSSGKPSGSIQSTTACESSKDEYFAVAVVEGAASFDFHVLRVSQDRVTTLRVESSAALRPSEHGSINHMFASCNYETNEMSVLTSSTGGTSAMFRFATTTSDDGSDKSDRMLWLQEEALASVKSSIFLDKHTPAQIDDDAKDISFAVRLSMQAESVLNLFKSVKKFIGFDTSGDVEGDSDVFGFSKIIVALAESDDITSRLFGLDSLAKGKTLWSILLPPESTKTFVMQDNISPITSSHKSELLVISHIPSKSVVEWRCVDGINGNVLDSGTLNAELAQVFPLSVTSKAKHCRQVALVLNKDETTSILPQSSESLEAAQSAIAEKDGLYLHSINPDDGSIRALHMHAPASASTTSTFATTAIGEAFVSEKIVSVGYASSQEMIQSPATVMGDDSLLLKYLNPNLAVVVSQASEETLKFLEENPSAFTSSSTTTSPGKKPLGATKPGEAAPTAQTATSPPSLFVSLVDTVSGKILHRTSHANASAYRRSGKDSVPVVVSENWVLYSYWNTRTQRSEIGVLTLYEGMIEKYGMTAFKSPEQETTFSSFGSAKPIVLQKTFCVGKPVSSIGVTQTTMGISPKNVLFGLESGQVYAVDRRLLDPRRPSSEPTASEKSEGLMRYAPNLPLLPQKMISYSQQVEGATYITSTSTSLESQSMVLAFGGPDVFFSRLAPSRSFDLLPENFNRHLLILVVTVLVGVTKYLQEKNKQSQISMGWS